MADRLAADRRQIGPYTLVKRLGAGGMGEVFLGRSRAGLAVAVKIINPSFAGDDGFRTRFKREALAARSVSGAFTAPVVDADLDVAEPWLATAFVPGTSLQEAVAEHGPMPAEAVFALAAGLAEALVSIHRAGVVHRDLKPSNVMLTPDGPKVIDFGIAHAIGGEAVTHTGQIVGTPGFMSPEQAAGGDPGPAGDVFCLGTLLAFAATGHSPYGPGRAEALVYRNAYEDPRLDDIRDPRLRELIAGCTVRDPGRRPTPERLLERLTSPPQGTSWLPDPLAAEIKSRAGEATALLRRRRLGVFAVVAAGCVLVLAAASGTELLSDLGLRHPACDAKCQQLSQDELDFIVPWEQKIETLQFCTAYPVCLRAAKAVEEPLRSAIQRRPDAARYSDVLTDLDQMRQDLNDLHSCPEQPANLIEPRRCQRALDLGHIGGGLMSKLFLVPAETARGYKPGQ